MNQIVIACVTNAGIHAPPFRVEVRAKNIYSVCFNISLLRTVELRWLVDETTRGCLSRNFKL
jgi:hypothetical protein